MSENVHYKGMSHIRTPQIIDKQIIEHKTHQQIARYLGVSTKTIQRDTNTPLYDTMINRFKSKYFDAIDDFLSGEEKTNRLEALKELGRMFRAGMTRTTRHTEDIKLTADLTITEKRKEKENLVKSLELTEDQYKILDAQFKTGEKES